MTEEEAAEREMQSRRIYKSRDALSADTKWTSASNTVFDGTYRSDPRRGKIQGAPRRDVNRSGAPLWHAASRINNSDDDASDDATNDDGDDGDDDGEW